MDLLFQVRKMNPTDRTVGRKDPSLRRLFYPESVAVVGASPEVKGDRFPFFQALQIANSPNQKGS
jgi:hypothetical protein